MVNKKLFFSVCMLLATLNSVAGSFPVTASVPAGANFVRLEWDPTGLPGYTPGRYRYVVNLLGEDGTDWQTCSANYGKTIRVLNIHPNITTQVHSPDKLKEWMEADGAGMGLITVDKVSMTNFNNNPDSYLKRGGEYYYDVIMFGSWDNNGADSDVPNAAAVTAITAFWNSGRGVLFGHDTLMGRKATFNSLAYMANINAAPASANNVGNTRVTVINNGFLLKYPNIIPDDATLTITECHVTAQQAKGVIWMNFAKPYLYGNDIIYPPAQGGGTNNFYLTTYNNGGMIQTGHTNGQATVDEKKIIANTLMYLAQFTDTTAVDVYCAMDLVPPEMEVELNCDKITLTGRDIGNTSKFYVTAVDNSTTNKYYSDTISATLKTGLKGYYIVQDNNNTATNLPGIAGHVFVAAKDNETVTYIATNTTATRIHIQAADSAGNLSPVYNSIFRVTAKDETPVVNNMQIACVDDPIAPRSDENICYRFTYANGSYMDDLTVASAFVPYKTNDSETPIGDTIKIAAGANGSSGFCFAGDLVEVEEVTGGDPLYNIYLKDVTKLLLPGTLLGNTNLTGTGYNPNIRMLLEVTQEVKLQSVSIFVDGSGGGPAGTRKTMTVIPVIYPTSGADVAGTGINLTTARSHDYFNGAKTELVIDLNNYTLAPGRYYLGFTIGGTAPSTIFSSTSPVGTGANNYLFTNPFKDNIDTNGLALFGVGSMNSTTASNMYIIANLKFTTIVNALNICDRVKLTAKYSCPTCKAPDWDLVAGKQVSITVPSEAKMELDTVILCNGDDVTLSLKQLMFENANATNQFDIFWYENGTQVKSTTPVPNGMDSYIVNAWTLTNPAVAEVKKYRVKVQDHAMQSDEDCWVWDSIYVKVNPTPELSSTLTPSAICSETEFDYTATSATTGTTFSWTRAAITGITPTTGSGGIFINETLINSTTSSITVTYEFTLSTGGCENKQNVTVTVNPTNTASAQSPLPATVCINTALTPSITHTTTGATGIGTASGLPTGVTASFAGNTITISGTPTDDGTFNYTIPLTGGCGTVSATGTITVTVANTVSAPSPASSTVCINTALSPSITHTTTGATGIGTTTGLPAGVTASFAGNAITISGTPIDDGTFNYTIPLTGGCGTVSATGTITVTAANTVNAPSPASSTVCINNALTPSITHTTTGATGIGTATGLPTGVTASFAGNTITISGTPTDDGTFNYTIPLTGGCGTVSATGTITVTAANTVSAPSPASSTVCINTALTPITHTTTGATGIGTATGLPAGVTASFAGNAITISGTPTDDGTFNYTIPLTGGCGTIEATGTITVITVNTASPPSPASSTVCINTALAPSITHTTTGATGIGTATGLPAGVTASFAGNAITISGTPTDDGTFNYTIPLTGGCGTVSATGTITVTAANTVSAPSPASSTVCINTALAPSITHTTTGATGIGTATGLPTGVTASFAGNTITISGTPTDDGTFNYTIPLTGGCGTVSATGTITVTAANTVSAPSPASSTVCINTALTPSITHTTTGATGIGTATGLPVGVTASFAGNAITISGTPTDDGTFNYTIPLTGGCGNVNATGTITVITVNTASSVLPTTVCINTALTPITHTTAGATGIGTPIDLPVGVTASWSGNTITISGTPTVDGTFNYTIPLTGGCGTVDATGTITVTTDMTVGTASSSPICINTPLTPITHATTGATGIGTPTGLPTGVTAAYAGNAITISGTPTVDGTFNYTIPLTGGCGNVNAIGTITVTKDMTAGAASSSPVCINTALTPITHTTTGATDIGTPTGLPDGVTAAWSGNTITISGTPTEDGTFNYTIPLTGGCGTVNATGTITVTKDMTVNAALSSPTLCINTALTPPITHTTTGATGIGAPTGLPTGVTAAWAGNIITISGTPAVYGTFNYTIPLTGGCGTVNATGTITVTKDMTVGTASSLPTCINTPLTPITHTTTDATGIGTATGLPAGVSASYAGNTITISGTPTASGTFNYSIPLTGGCGNVNATGTITVTPNMTAGAASSMPTVCINTALTTITHATTGATGIGVATGLPAGVTATHAGNTITISGTPTVSGIFTYTIPLTGSCGTINATGTIRVTTANTAGIASSTPTLCINTALTPVTHTTTGATGIGTATGLPTGVTASFAGNTITISGTPTASGTFNYSIPLTGGCGSVNATGTIVVNQLPTLTQTPAIQVICEEETVLLAVNPTSPSTNATWYDEQKAMVGTGMGILVTPPYKKNGNSYQSTYHYEVTLIDGYGCEASFTVPVKIDEMLRGRITPNTSICEGMSITIDASSYYADTHSWTSPAFEEGVIKTESKIIESPAETATYTVKMSRGTCTETDYTTIEVNSKPVIFSIDSIGVRDRAIRYEPGTGTPPFKFGVDNQPADDDSEKYNLFFGWHSFYIIDNADCHSEVVNWLVEPPKLVIPPYFSPNGDGINDTWEIEGMRTIYPDAVVTIYDRFGKQLVQYKGSADTGWDGMYNGKQMPTTDYWYVIDINEIDKQYVGHFTLLRR